MISQPHTQVDELVQLQNAYEELRIAYEREVQYKDKLQKEYNELNIMMRHQQKMFAMVKDLMGSRCRRL